MESLFITVDDLLTGDETLDNAIIKGDKDVSDCQSTRESLLYTLAWTYKSNLVMNQADVASAYKAYAGNLEIHRQPELAREAAETVLLGMHRATERADNSRQVKMPQYTESLAQIEQEAALGSSTASIKPAQPKEPSI